MSSTNATSSGQKQQVQLSLVPEATPNFDLSDLNVDEEDSAFAEYKKILQRFEATVSFLFI